MANWYEPTQKQIREWDKWIETRPPIIQKLAHKFPPWKLFMLKTTGQRVYPYSFSENGTLTVMVDARFNLVLYQVRVFGINPDDLIECNLPDESQPVGVLLDNDKAIQHINSVRKLKGIPSLTEEEIAAFPDCEENHENNS